MSDQSDKRFLQIVVCAAGVAADVGRLMTTAHERHWDVGVVATPQGLGFLDAEGVEAQTGRPIRSAWRSPGEPRPSRPADAVAVAPVTFNTVNKWAAWISDLNSAQAVVIGLLRVVVPCVRLGEADQE
ncbi:hypothetical protein GCM10010424_19480 [Streptomyces lienomycini]